MGLSKMTNSKNLRYAINTYINPSFGKWEEWYAWYPVRLVKLKPHDTIEQVYYIKVFKWVWLQKIVRRKVIDMLDGPGRESAGSKVYYEYTTLMELLNNGH